MSSDASTPGRLAWNCARHAWAMAAKPSSTRMSRRSASGTDFTGAASTPRARRTPRSALLMSNGRQSNALAHSSASANSASGWPALSSSSISQMGWLFFPARTSPTSNATSICAPPRPVSSQAVRSKRVSNTGTSCARSASGTSASASAGNRLQSGILRATGISNSARCDSPPRRSPSVFSVCSQRRPTRRTRNATPCALRSKSGVSKYRVISACCTGVLRRRAIRLRKAAACCGGSASLSSISTESETVIYLSCQEKRGRLSLKHTTKNQS